MTKEQAIGYLKKRESEGCGIDWSIVNNLDDGQEINDLWVYISVFNKPLDHVIFCGPERMKELEKLLEDEINRNKL